AHLGNGALARRTRLPAPKGLLDGKGKGSIPRAVTGALAPCERYRPSLLGPASPVPAPRLGPGKTGRSERLLQGHVQHPCRTGSHPTRLALRQSMPTLPHHRICKV